MTIETSTLERLVPDYIEPNDDTGLATFQLHLQRYQFAAKHARPGRLLDIACGVGYGARLLSDAHPAGLTVVGVDLSSEAIAYARSRYASPRITFVNEDATRFNEPAGFNTIVSLETIEHLPDPDNFIAHVLKLLQPNGLFIASVPVTPSVDANPHHLHDFTRASFRRMLTRHGLVERAHLEQVQRFNPISVVQRTESRMSDMRQNLPGYYVSHPGKLFRRLVSTMIDGFNNKYITIVAEKPD